MADLRTDLLVIGAGPYAYSAAAYARERGIETHMVGEPMAFWRDQMPADMYLRSGPDWSLDAAGQDTFEAYFEDAGLDPADVDPIPIGVFLDHTDWFARRKGLEADRRMVADLTEGRRRSSRPWRTGPPSPPTRCWRCPGSSTTRSCRPGTTTYLPTAAGTPASWSPSTTWPGGRFAIIGGRQSAYEWAALLCDHGAAKVDVVHRHETPAFEKVSWKFVDPLVEHTLATRGWWRDLPATEQQAIALQFWQVGRLTLEWWLTPRLKPEVVTSHPLTEVAGVEAGDDDVTLTLSDGERLTVDRVVFASGYKAELGNVPYLAGVRSTGSRSPTASRTSAPASRPAWRTSTSPASPPPATSARSTASPRAARRRAGWSSTRCCADRV